MLAIPILYTRVAPVLDWCSRIRIFFTDQSDEGEGEEFQLAHLEPEERLKFLKAKGVKVVICGTLSGGLLHCARQLGLNIICGVAGEVGEVFRSYQQNRLNQPRFWLPGCRRVHRHRGRGCGRGRGKYRRS